MANNTGLASLQPPQRKIIHIDMDAFYAAVEQREKPALVGKPVVVGGLPNRRGVVSTCNYEARRYGIHSAMPSTRALTLCPHAVFIRPNFALYRDVSQQIFSLLHEYTHHIETLALDEAYMDVSAVAAQHQSATALAVKIKQRILTATGLTASAGIAANKFLAKIASAMDKPDGLFIIKPAESEQFVAGLTIRKFHGIGPATEKRMHNLGIYTGADLRRHSLQQLTEIFGKAGLYYYHAARGIDKRPVQANAPRKSVGAENTFAHDLHEQPLMLKHLNEAAVKVARMLAARKISGRTVTIKVKYADFTQATRSRTLPEALSGLRQLRSLLPELLSKTKAAHKPVRLLGVTVSNLCSSEKNHMHAHVVKQPGFLDE